MNKFSRIVLVVLVLFLAATVVYTMQAVSRQQRQIGELIHSVELLTEIERNHSARIENLNSDVGRHQEMLDAHQDLIIHHEETLVIYEDVLEKIVEELFP